MKPCPHCQKSLPDKATICIGCGRPVAAQSQGGATPPSSREHSQGVGGPPPPPGKRAAAPSGVPGSPPSTAGATKARKTVLPPRPGPVQGPVSGVDSLKQKAVALEQLVKRKKLVGWSLAVGAAVLLLLGVVAGRAYYASSVLSYAKLDADLRIERNPLDPDRLALHYRPVSLGLVGFRRVDEDRDTELFDQIAEIESGERKFEWRWQGVQISDVVKVTYRNGWSLETAVLKVPKAPPTPPLGNATLSGQIVDATNNQPIAGAQIRIVGTPLTAVSGTDGTYQITEAPSGVVAVEVSAKDFSIDQFERELVTDATTEARVALSPGMKEGQIRIVLTWGDEPQDLDAHLEGPLPSEERFHIFFGEKGDLKSKEFVSLDVDDRDGNGPETITVLGVLPGVYHYFVHDYTNGDSLESDELARSGAEVKVLQGGQTYRFRADNESVGNIWRICDIIVTQDGATLRRLDRYESKLMKKSQGGDLVLVMDVSGSMSSLIGQAKQACYELLKVIPFESGARAGLVTFGRSTRKVQDITQDRELLRNAIAPLYTGGGTPMAEGLKIGLEMLRESNARPTVVLFTDGGPDDESRTLLQASELKEAGIDIWAIGTAGANIGFLRQLASAPEQATFSTPDELQQVFGTTAQKIFSLVDEAER